MKINNSVVPFSAYSLYIPQGHSPKVYIDLVKTQCLGVDREGKQRPDEDLMLFLVTAKRTGLDPLAKQIYAVYRWDSRLGREKMTIQAGIDGMRATAEKSELYAGSDDAVFEEKDGKPTKATVTVYKLNRINGERMPVTASARWAEYAQFNSKTGEVIGQWKDRPYLMLGKCAEALALRKAFPNDLSGIYTEDEYPREKLTDSLPTPSIKHGEPVSRITLLNTEKAVGSVVEAFEEAK